MELFFCVDRFGSSKPVGFTEQRLPDVLKRLRFVLGHARSNPLCFLVLLGRAGSGQKFLLKERTICRNHACMSIKLAHRPVYQCHFAEFNPSERGRPRHFHSYGFPSFARSPTVIHAPMLETRSDTTRR